MDGAEYLRRVRWEARHSPQVVRAHVDPTSLAPLSPPPKYRTSTAQATPDCALELKPRRSWLAVISERFAELRMDLARMPAGLRGGHEGGPEEGGAAAVAWHHRHFAPEDAVEGHVDPEGAVMRAQGAALSTSGRGPAPTLSVVCPLDHVTASRLLQQHVQWLETHPLTPARATWLFALMARVDQPLDDDTGAALRHLVRVCGSRRAEARGRRDPMLPHLAVLMAVAGGFFGQEDPAILCRPG